MWLLGFNNYNFHCVFHACLLCRANVTGFPILVVVLDRTLWLLIVEHLSCLEVGDSSVCLIRGLTGS